MSYKLDPTHLTTFDDRTDRSIAREFFDCLGEKQARAIGVELLIEHDRSRTKPFNNPNLHDFRLRGGTWTDFDGWAFDRRDRQRCRLGKGSIGMVWNSGQFHCPGAYFAKDCRVDGDIIATAGYFEGGVSGFGILAPGLTYANPQYFTGIVACACKEAHALDKYPSVVMKPSAGQGWMEPSKNLIQLKRDMVGAWEYGMAFPYGDNTAVVAIGMDHQKQAMVEQMDADLLILPRAMDSATYGATIQRARDFCQQFPPPRATAGIEQFARLFIDAELDPEIQIYAVRL